MQPLEPPPPLGRFARLPPFVQLFVTGVTVAMSGHAILARGFDWIFTFGAAYRMPLAHLVHPLPYVVLVSGVYAALGSYWLWLGPSPSRWRRTLTSLGILVATIALSAGPGGMIWVYHDMCAGYFPPLPQMIEAFRWGFTTGIQTAPYLVMTAVPMNVISVIVGHTMLMRLAARGDLRAVSTAPS